MIAADLEKHPERSVVWRFASGVSVVCISGWQSTVHPDYKLIEGQTYVAIEYMPREDLLLLRDHAKRENGYSGWVRGERFRLR
jgi:hypothetical protein